MIRSLPPLKCIDIYGLLRKTKISFRGGYIRYSPQWMIYLHALNKSRNNTKIVNPHI
jgi:hypothetical protein